MKQPVKSTPAPIEERKFQRWRKRRAPVPGPPPERKPKPLAERMPEYIPTGSTRLAKGGRSFLTTTPAGTDIGWDTCGRCAAHVMACKCITPRAPRSVAYTWFQDEAVSKGETWDHEHPNYSRSFSKPTAPTKPDTRSRKRVRRKQR